MKDNPARWWLAGAVLITLIVGAVTLSALGRPLVDLLALVFVVVIPIMGGLGYSIKEQTNGNTTALLDMVRRQAEANSEARAQEVRAAQEAREQDKAELLALVREALAAAPPPHPLPSAEHHHHNGAEARDQAA